jgi:lactoylglutathione lyase
MRTKAEWAKIGTR